MDAAQYKSLGNQAFAAQKFDEATEAFTKAIEMDETNYVLWSNRSAAYASQRKFELAKSDAEKCVSLNPSWAKGYARLGSALHGLRDWSGALAAYNKGLEIEPENATIREGIAAVENERASRSDPFAKVFGFDTFSRIQCSPQLSQYLLMPDYVQMINTVIQNPSMAQHFMKDQRMMATFLVLSGIQLPESSPDFPRPQQSTRKEEGQTTEAEEGKKKQPNESKPVSEAQKRKEQGNTFYKLRQFDEALAEYRGALELEPTNTTYLLNVTAVYFEQGQYDACIEACDEALEHGREHKVSFTIIAKLMTRKAMCLQRLQRHTEAIELFKQSLLEDRNAVTLAKLNACEKEKRQLDEAAYRDPEISIQKKEEGNSYFKDQKYPEAVECYTEAIKRNPDEHVLYSNRAAAYIKLGAYNEALKDCDKCVELNPSFVKAYARRGHAYYWTKQYNRALQAYDEGLRLDATSSECMEGKLTTIRKIEEMNTGGGDEEVAHRAMADPEIAAILHDSYMQLVLKEIERSPQRLSEYMRDPTIASKINKLIASGVLQMKRGPAPP